MTYNNGGVVLHRSMYYNDI